MIEVQIRWKHVLSIVGGFCVFAGVFFAAVWQLMVYSQNNLTARLSDVVGEQAALRGTDGSLDDRLDTLIAAIDRTNGNLETLNNTVKSIEANLSASVGRQENFEKWVVAQLGRDPSNIAFYPDGWNNDVVIKGIWGGTNPLDDWMKGITGKKLPQ